MSSQSLPQSPGGTESQAPIKPVAASRREAAGNSAVFWGDRCKAWIAYAILNDDAAKRAEDFARSAATYAATCARMQGGA